MGQTTGERIRERRKAAGLTPEDIAAQIGKSAPTVYRYEQGDYKDIPAAVIDQLAALLGTSVGYLMQFTADPRPTEDDQSAADYLRYIKVHEIARETLHQTHSRQLINKYRLEKKMERYLGLLTDEDMHSLLDYLAFLASRHTEEALKEKRSI